MIPARHTASTRAVRRLSDLLEGVGAVDPAHDATVTGMTVDSRRVGPGDLFLACAGNETHGAEFISSAIRAGAAAVVVEPPLPTAETGDVGVPVVMVADLRDRLGRIAARFYGDPSSDLHVVGVTGTNGKTSCCHYLAQALGVDGVRCGVIGTLGYGPYGDLSPGEHTTPDAITLQRELARLRDIGTRHVVMEVSSHALQQGRVNEVKFDGAVFTNLSHEHLDYHGDLGSYGRAKQRLFAGRALRYVVLNHDDAFGRQLARELPPSVDTVYYGLNPEPTDIGEGRYVWCRALQLDATGLQMHIRTSWGEGSLRASLLGRFNASNLLAALGVLLMLDLPFDEALSRLERTRAVPGRMERFDGGDRAPMVVVDYAHTPDALRQALATLRPHCAGRLWCVFGCGGQRDAAKRPLMGSVAERGADRVILTNDNPRRETPESIIAQIRSGMASPGMAEAVLDRSAAIRRAITGAGPGDMVLVAGKGHEESQIVGDEKRPFSDRNEVQRALEEVA